MNCHHCKFHRNCINGAWCTNLKAYVEHQLIENCSYYEEKKHSSRAIEPAHGPKETLAGSGGARIENYTRI